MLYLCNTLPPTQGKRSGLYENYNNYENYENYENYNNYENRPNNALHARSCTRSPC